MAVHFHAGRVGISVKRYIYPFNRQCFCGNISTMTLDGTPQRWRLRGKVQNDTIFHFQTRLFPHSPTRYYPQPVTWPPTSLNRAQPELFGSLLLAHQISDLAFLGLD